MSALPLFYHPLLSVTDQETLLPAETARHVVQVLRMRAGEQLQLTNGKGLLSTAAIKAIDKKSCSVAIEDVQEHQPQKGVHLAIAFTKNAARNEWVLEKATELGVQRITPLITARTEKLYLKRDRWEGILVSAMLQSQQYFLPVLDEPTSIKKALELPAQKLLAHCESVYSKTPLKEITAAADCVLFIGPEGDFSPDEIQLAIQHGCIGISLGDTRLRTETAAMAACAYLHLNT